MEIQMQALELNLEVHSSEAGAAFKRLREPAWEAVNQVIDRIFVSGGSVRLVTSRRVYSPHEGDVMHDAVEMLALPRRYRLVVSPFKKAGERSNQREWWAPADGPFVGTEAIDDDEYDSRTFCTDIHVAKSLLEDFFTNRQITQRLVDATLSVWTPKPRSG